MRTLINSWRRTSLRHSYSIRLIPEFNTWIEVGWRSINEKISHLNPFQRRTLWPNQPGLLISNQVHQTPTSNCLPNYQPNSVKTKWRVASGAPLADRSRAEWEQSAGVIQRGARRSRVKWVEHAATPGPHLESGLVQVTHTAPPLQTVPAAFYCLVLTPQSTLLHVCCWFWQLLIGFEPPAKQQFHIHLSTGCEAEVDILEKK